LSILEDNFTVRLHLDNTTVQNGALKVVPGSHRKGIYRTGDKNWSSENEVICEVPAGGMMLMKPLLLHSSSRSTNNQQRRVIHIEFSRQTLPAPLRWSEMIE
jgi:ectoine hydroxylase-related dioxygenase (phytanoyl-CoA dioxygenase family)